MGKKLFPIQGLLLLSAIVSALLYPHAAEARKASQALYENSFDIGAGGASLTRATQEGMLFQNPAQLPYGGKIFRWLGLRTGILTGKESVDLARNLASGSSNEEGDSGEESAEDSGDGDSGGGDFVERVFQTPIHIGQTNALSLITNNGGISVFTRVEPDIFAEETGDLGVPAIHFSSEAYAGAIGSFASQTYWRWLSLGVSAKYLMAAEPEINISLSDQEAVQELASDGGIAESLTSYNTGMGFDAGALIFVQNYAVDYRFALKADDIGNTTLTGNANPDALLQTVHAGMGITFHNLSNAIHLAIDYRDILNAYEEKMFKKVYIGGKATLLTYLGIGAGLYHGNPSYGLELDLIFMRIGGSFYTRELGEAPGDRSRPIYSLTFASGFDF